METRVKSRPQRHGNPSRGRFESRVFFAFWTQSAIAARVRSMGVNYHLFSQFGTPFGDEQFRALRIHNGIGADFLDFLALCPSMKNTSC